MLYLSNLSPWYMNKDTSGPQMYGNDDACQQAVPLRSSPDIGDSQPSLHHALPMLYDEFAIARAYPGEYSSQIPAGVPIARNQTAAELALEAVEVFVQSDDRRSQYGGYLIYAHDTPEPSFYLTPSLMMKKRLGLKRIQPIAVSDCGSTAFSCAVELLACLGTDATSATADSIIVVSDQLAPPMPRLWHNLYPFGDAAIACIGSPSHGTWEVVDQVIEEWPCLTKQPYTWSEEENSKHHQLLIEHSCATLERYRRTSFMQSDKIRYGIIQQISASFEQAVSLTISDIPIYSRRYASACNLLGSDCLYTLHELEQERAIQPEEEVLLVMAGPLTRVSLMLLRRTDATTTTASLRSNRRCP